MKHLIATTLLILLSIQLFSQSYLSELNNKNQFEELSGAPLANKYGNVKAVKVVYDMNNDSLYYISAKDYKNHYEFCKQKLSYLNGMGNFLKHNYSTGSKRKYLLANLNYFQSIDKYVIEISSTDLMVTEQIKQICSLIKRSSFVGANVSFLANSPRLQTETSEISKEIAVISPHEIYGDLSYQAVSKYSNSGILRIIDNVENNGENLTPTDIVILKNIPNYLPGVAGVVVTEFQTPLSHISILGLNRKIPICAYTKIFNNKNILALEGQQVLFTVSADTFSIVPDTSKLVEKQSAAIPLKVNLEVDSIIDIEDLNKESATFTGSKAANFGELYHISKTADFKTPEAAFAIPFYFYAQHIEQSKVKKKIDKLIKKTPSKTDKLNKKLNKIQEKINNTAVDPALIEAIENRMKANPEYAKLRFRSSTNAEDIEGFSGAGLYASKSAKLNSEKKSVEKALQTVWASIWSYQAFSEREYYNIDQSNVAMGVLAHRSFPNEQVNGVAITKNIYRKNSNGFLVNAQVGNENVVKPSSGVVCDQFICFPSKSNKIYKDKIIIDIITYSSLNDNKLTMSESEVQHLADQLNIIKRHYAGDVNTWTYTRIGYDLEFKLDGNSRQLYIKQIRPYND